MFTIFWDKPVNAGGRLIFGPLDAQRYMMEGWPVLKDGAFTAAANAILDALARKGSPDFARELFEVALRGASAAKAGQKLR